MRGWQRHGRGLWIRGFRGRNEDWKTVQRRKRGTSQRGNFDASRDVTGSSVLSQPRGHCRHGVCVSDFLYGSTTTSKAAPQLCEHATWGTTQATPATQATQPPYSPGIFLVQTFYLTSPNRLRYLCLKPLKYRHLKHTISPEKLGLTE